MNESSFEISDIPYILAAGIFLYLFGHILNLIDMNVYKLDTRYYFCNILNFHTSRIKMNDREIEKFWDDMISKFDFWMETRNIKYYRYKYAWSYVEDIWKKSATGLTADRFAMALFYEFYKSKDKDWGGYCLDACYDPKKKRPRNFIEHLLAFIKQ